MQKRLLFVAFLLLAICNKIVADDQLTVSDVSMYPGDSKEVSIQLTNMESYVGFQFDLYLPNGITIESYSRSSRIPDGTTLELTIDSGSAGQNRIDVVASEFVRGGGETADTHAIKIIKGTAVSGTPAAPAMTTSNLLNAGNVNRVALYYVTLSGTEITGISRVAQHLPTSSDGAPNIYVQQSQPSAPQTGDLWIW